MWGNRSAHTWVTGIVAGVLLGVLGLAVPQSAGAAPAGGPDVTGHVSPGISSPLYCLSSGCSTGGRPSAGASGTAGAASPPPVETFAMSAMAVTAGSQVSLHWGTSAGLYFILTSTAPGALPNFGSSTAVTWPASPGGFWSGPGQWWATTGGAVTVAIPSGAAAGSTYRLQLYTCDSVSGLCSNSPGGGGSAQVSLTVAANWTVASYEQGFSKIGTMAQTSGSPLDVAFSGASTIWNSSEFSDAIGESGKKSALTSIPDPADVANQPFALCFLSPCTASGWSALGERVVYANGLVWFTQGGWLGFPGGTVANHSEIVAYNPKAGAFCTYLVPGNDNEVIGMAVTGKGRKALVWFIESDFEGGHPSIDSFSPSQVGESCPNDYSLSGSGSFRRIPWPQADVPALIAVDPNGTTLWVTDFLGSAVDGVDVATGAITPHSYPPTNSYSQHGAEPWQVVADANYVYAIDYGDSNLIRLNKADGQIDQVPIPLTSDTEQGYGLALSGSRLFFSLSDDAQPAFGAASTVGYVDLSTWEAASSACPPGVDCAPAPTAAVVYTGLSEAADPTTDADFRGIAVSTRGWMAIADLHQVVRLAP